MSELRKDIPTREEPGPPAQEVSPEFLAMLAHELRNPLAPIRNAAAALRALCSEPQQLKMVELIARNTVSMTRLLEDLLEAARMRRGRLVLQRQVVDVVELVNHALDNVKPAIESQHQSIVVSLPVTEARMYCDPVRIEQTLQILLDNANRYTPRGGTIRLRAQVRGGQLEFEVADNGTGIDPELMPQLFNVFAQGERTLDRAQGGLGVGLAIARNLVELHGGTIAAESQGLNRGSRFLITLPLADPPVIQQVESPTTVQTAGLRVLVIDDVEDNAATLAHYLATRGHDPRTASRGKVGLREADAFAPHAAIIDIGLPDMSGFEVARELRERLAPARVLLIAVSGYEPETTAHLSDRSAFDHYLVKPADPDLIASYLERFLRQV
ncbi:MAG TPA: hybrid sensor histidine kinase/response regulator [Steroidobacteraceae bacterium]|nr:hybrid sensor histidine kinase/response regulator [Steroidobacteraceae bacterium]